MESTCALCKESLTISKETIVIKRDRINDGNFTYVCDWCEDVLKHAFVRCGCSYDSVERECPEKDCRYYEKHVEGCGYHRCNNCVYGVCDCGYNPKSKRCRGEKCRNYGYDSLHTATCTYWECEDCVPTEYDSDGNELSKSQ